MPLSCQVARPLERGAAASPGPITPERGRVSTARRAVASRRFSVPSLASGRRGFLLLCFFCRL